MILRRGDGLVADIAGFSVPVKQQGKKLSFELPDGKGSFRGEHVGGQIDGQWIQPVTVEGGARYATPLVLRADGDERWTGTGRAARGPYDLLSSGHARRRRPLLDLFAQPGAQPGRVPRSVADRAGRRHGAAGRNAARPGRRERHCHRAARSRGGHVQPSLFGRTFDFARETDRSSPFYARGNPPERYRYSPPVQLDDGWPVSTLEKEGIDQAAIERFVQKLIDMRQDSVSTSQIHSLLIARHGKLVLEEYFHGFDRDTPHDTRSASKSWTNVLIGAAMQAGVPIRLDTPVYETMLGSVPADLDPRKKAMTLEHLISMTAGFDCDDSGERPGDEDPMQEQTAEPDWYRYSLNVPMAWNSGEKIVYCSMKPNLAAGMLEKIAGEPLPEMFYRLVAKPMRMSQLPFVPAADRPALRRWRASFHHPGFHEAHSAVPERWQVGRAADRQPRVGAKHRARRCVFFRRPAARPTAISGTRSRIRIADASCTHISRAGTVARYISGFPTSTY